jgi:acyl-CoA synthetase (NDP forming)
MPDTGQQKQNGTFDIFYPESIAIAGVSSDSGGFSAGRNFLDVLIEAGYKGKIYPLNPKGGQVIGYRIYTSLQEIPGNVDYVISAVPARSAPQLMMECVAKQVKQVHIFTAGFSESGEEVGKELELKITDIARQGGIRFTGPNGMGLYCPESGLAFSPGLSTESGPVGFLSQSGSNVSYVIREGSSRGLFFSKAVSYGNAADMNESDFIEYLADDSETTIIGAYIEGVKNGRRFLSVTRKAANKKPVIVLKGGITEAGKRSVASHTGSIAGTESTWSAVLTQAGVIQVYSLDELVDTTLLFRFMSPPKGRNVAIVGFGGGIGVQAADFCNRAGLQVPAVSKETKDKLSLLWPAGAGSSLGNPFDLFGSSGEKSIEMTLSAIAEWEQAQIMLIHVPVFINPRAGVQVLKTYTRSLVNLAPKLNTRTVVVLNYILDEDTSTTIGEARTTLYRAGYPVYYSVDHAINALGRFVRYYQTW